MSNMVPSYATDIRRRLLSAAIPFGGSSFRLFITCSFICVTVGLHGLRRHFAMDGHELDRAFNETEIFILIKIFDGAAALALVTPAGRLSYALDDIVER